jgi:hypothetical protein
MHIANLVFHFGECRQAKVASAPPAERGAWGQNGYSNPLATRHCSARRSACNNDLLRLRFMSHRLLRRA